MVDALEPFDEIREALIEAGGETLTSCFKCGTCTATCPWNLVTSATIRRMIHQAQLGLADYEEEEIWMCSSCLACTTRCPRGVATTDIMRAIRRVMAEYGAVPKTISGAMASIKGEGNPWSEPRQQRTAWTRDLDVPKFTGDKEYFYFSCCTNCYDPRNIKVTRAQVALLTKAGVSFGIIGEQESCCCEAIRKAGGEDIFLEFAEKNITLFNENGVKKIITTSPHCYHTIKNEYGDLNGDFEVIHVAQLVNRLIKSGALQLKKAVKKNNTVQKKVAYHDPCYLGRHNDIYDEPRELLQAIPGLELVEMPNYCENSLCCGGGGGGIWLERVKGQRICDVRVEQALEAGAEILATCCPYCISNFEDSVKTLDKEEILAIADVTELVRTAAGIE